jgi:prevent-host-death family protein
MTQMATTKARADFAEVVNRAAHKGERILLSRNGKSIAAIVPVEDVALLEELEEKADMAALRAALAETRRRREKPIPWARARKMLGL